jgi:nucleotide-binding universal stress UspA family protein
MFNPRLILHPTDYSESSKYAMQVAADLAGQYQARILILHVVETLGPENVTFGEATSQLEPSSYRQRLEEDLRQREPAPPGLPVEYLLAEGDTAQEIQRVAQDRGCDLIVMGAHGRGGFLSRLVMGRTAEKVIRLAPCPVLTTKISIPQPSSSH